MSELAKPFFYICLLSKGPQDIPYSINLFRLGLLLYLLTAILTLTQGMVLEQAIAASIVDMVILLIFARLSLRFFNKLARFIQMTTALLVIGAVFQIMALPLLMSIQAGEKGNAEISLIVLLLFSWNLAVYAHIFRETFEIKTGLAFVITLVYTLISFSANQMLFPQAGA